jgi:hypothetical protein
VELVYDCYVVRGMLLVLMSFAIVFDCFGVRGSVVGFNVLF